MKTATHESDFGVSFHVEYTEDATGITFQRVQVIDVNYAPTGPDLVPFLHEVCVPSLRLPDGSLQAETYLSRIGKELRNGR